MKSWTIDLAWDDASAPRQLKEARAALFAALTQAGRLPCWNEWAAGDRWRPPHAKRARGVCLFVNGQPAWNDMAGWNDPPALRAAIEAVASATEPPPPREPLERRLRYAVLPSLGMAILPKCPFCWAAYAATLTSAGLTPASAHRSIVIALGVAVALSAASVSARSRRQGAIGPAVLALVGATGVLGGRLWLDSLSVLCLGLIVLAGAAVWSAWPTTGTAPSHRPREVV